MPDIDINSDLASCGFVAAPAYRKPRKPRLVPVVIVIAVAVAVAVVLLGSHEG
jgi:hypothetical protein